MKSRLYPMLLLLICTITAQAQEYHVETPGTLQEVIGPGAEELTRIRVTGTLSDRDIAFLHRLCWPIAPKPKDMKYEDYLKMAMEKEETLKTCLRHLDMEDARMVNDDLPDRAFDGSFIRDYKLPKTLKKIGKNAFSCNVLLKELIIPESVEEIGRNLLFFSIKVEKVRFPDNLEVMNDMLCAECWELKEVNIPSKVREIYGGIFDGCLKAPASIAVLPETVEILDGHLYCAIPSIESVVVPPKVRIMRGAFYGVPNLKKVTIQTDKLTEIGADAFYCCENLEDINIPDGVTRIGRSAFYCNLSLRKINIPSSVTYIAEEAFACTHLDSIDIPAGVTFIGRGAFWKCDKLKKVYSRPVIPPVTNAWSPPHLPFESDQRKHAPSLFPKALPRPTVPLRYSLGSRIL